MVISMYGNKTTKQNVLREGIFSANLVSTDMLDLMDYSGMYHNVGKLLGKIGDFSD